MISSPDGNLPKTEIYVAAHKKMELVLPDIYTVCQVNAVNNEKWEDCAHDDDCDDNLSSKNYMYSELSALYVLWKNSRADIKGIAHYRRFFVRGYEFNAHNYIAEELTSSDLEQKVINETEIHTLLKDHDIIMEYPLQPEVFSAYEDLLKFVYPHDIKTMTEVIQVYFPEYLSAYNKVMQSTHISYLNMFIAKKEVVDQYCEWLFNVLALIEERIDLSDYDAQHKRLLGYLGEVLLNVWVLKNELKIGYTFTKQVNDDQQRMKQIVKSIAPGLTLIVNRKKGMAYRHLQEGAADYSFTIEKVLEKPYSIDRIVKSFRGCANAGKGIMRGDGRSLEYAIALFESDEGYSYVQSNNVCIICAIIQDVHQCNALIKHVTEKYRDKYTVCIRLITSSQAVYDHFLDKPEITVIFDDSLE